MTSAYPNRAQNAAGAHAASNRKRLDPLAVIGFAFAAAFQIIGIIISFLQTLLISRYTTEIMDYYKYMSIFWFALPFVFSFISLGFGLAAAQRSKDHLASYTLGIIAATLGAKGVFGLLHTPLTILAGYISMITK